MRMPCEVLNVHLFGLSPNHHGQADSFHRGGAGRPTFWPHSHLRPLQDQVIARLENLSRRRSALQQVSGFDLSFALSCNHHLGRCGWRFSNVEERSGRRIDDALVEGVLMFFVDAPCQKCAVIFVLTTAEAMGCKD